MYFPVGWPKILALPHTDRESQQVLKVSFDREKFMFAVVTTNSLGIWFNNVSLFILVIADIPVELWS